MIDRYLKVILVLILIVAFGIRLGAALNTGVQHAGSAVNHAEIARNLVEGRGFVTSNSYADIMAKVWPLPLPDLEDVPPPANEEFEDISIQTPGPALLIASTYLVFGEYRYVYSRILQALIDTFGCLIIYLLGRKLFNKRVGIISAVIYALFIPIAFLSTTTTHDAIMPFLLLSSLYLFVTGVLNNSTKYFIFSAIVTGISCYFQPSVLFLPFVYGLGLFIYNIHKSNFRLNLWKTTRITAIMIVTLFIIITPWIIRNHQISGVWSPTMRGTAAWSIIWCGIGEFPDNPIGATLSSLDALGLAQKELGHDVQYGSTEFESVFKPKVLGLIEDYPSWYISAIVRRIPRTIFYVSSLGFEEGILKNVPLVRTGNKVSWYSYPQAFQNGTLIKLVIGNLWTTFYWGMVTLFGYATPIIALGGVIVARNRWRIMALLLTVTAYLSMVHMASFVTACGKSLLPGSVAFIILSAVFIDFCYQKIKVN